MHEKGDDGMSKESGTGRWFIRSSLARSTCNDHLIFSQNMYCDSTRVKYNWE
jgi:hypothetical protein